MIHSVFLFVIGGVLKAEYHVERSGNSMPRGRILELKNNYGIIDTDAYKVEHEWIPFRIEKSMLEGKRKET